MRRVEAKVCRLSSSNIHHFSGRDWERALKKSATVSLSHSLLALFSHVKGLRALLFSFLCTRAAHFRLPAIIFSAVRAAHLDIQLVKAGPSHVKIFILSAAGERGVDVRSLSLCAKKNLI